MAEETKTIGDVEASRKFLEGQINHSWKKKESDHGGPDLFEVTGSVTIYCSLMLKEGMHPDDLSDEQKAIMEGILREKIIMLWKAETNKLMFEELEQARKIRLEKLEVAN